MGDRALIPSSPVRYADLLALIPFAVLCVCFTSSGRDVLLASRKRKV